MSRGLFHVKIYLPLDFRELLITNFFGWKCILIHLLCYVDSDYIHSREEQQGHFLQFCKLL